MAILAPHSDRAVQEYRHRSGARDTYWINELVKYVRSEGLYDNFRLYPFMPRTNADSGSTAFGLGGLTANDMTLVNGPTWGTSGLAFASASSQYGSIADFLGSETLTVFHRASEASATPTADVSLISQFDTGSNQRSWWLRHTGNEANDPYKLVRYSDGTTSNFESYEIASASSTDDRCFVAQWVDGGGRSLWFNKSAQTLSLTAGSAQTSRFNSSADILLNAVKVAGVPSLFNDQTAHALAFITGTLTTTQRETITDLINEL